MKTIQITSKLVLLLLVVTILGFSSCKKTVVGPQGETGQTGETGATGNANVKAHLISTTCEWKADSTDHSYSYRQPLEDLDMNTLLSGLVMTYYGSQCGCEWKSMPFQNRNLSYTFSLQLSNVIITLRSDDGRMPEYPGVQKFKLVIIPPAQ